LSSRPAVTAVTGARGFIGGHVRQALLARGHTVRSLTRGPVLTPDFVSIPDFGNAALVRDAFAGADAVVHLAARAHVMHERASDPRMAYREANVGLTRHVLEAAVAANVRHFVFASSVKVMGECNDMAWTEQDSPHPLDAYAQSKLEAEELVLDMAARHNMRATVLRLPMLYGPGNKGNMARLYRLIDRGLPLPLGAIVNRRSLAYVGNVVGAIEVLLNGTLTGQEVFFVSDQEDLSTPDLLRLIGRSLGRAVHLLPIAPALLLSLGRGFDWVLRTRRLTPALERLMLSLRVDSSKLARVTGFVPPYSPETGLMETGRWFRSVGAVGS
jgi:nucleoside-diphosphate-sugar epimerase